MRLFVAVELSPEVRRAMRHVIDELSHFARMVRWVKSEQMHLTMKFLGDVPDRQVADVCNVCAAVAENCPPFELVVDRCGCFPASGRVRVIWCGSSVDCSAPRACATRLDGACARLGLKRETRPFAVHLTVGRVREDRTEGRLRHAVEHLHPPRAAQRVEALTVFQSTLSPQGPTYTALGRFQLGGAE